MGTLTRDAARLPLKMRGISWDVTARLPVTKYTAPIPRTSKDSNDYRIVLALGQGLLDTISDRSAVAVTGVFQSR